MQFKSTLTLRVHMRQLISNIPCNKRHLDVVMSLLNRRGLYGLYIHTLSVLLSISVKSRFSPFPFHSFILSGQSSSRLQGYPFTVFKQLIRTSGPLLRDTKIRDGRPEKKGKRLCKKKKYLQSYTKGRLIKIVGQRTFILKLLYCSKKSKK